ncbi:MAG: glutathione S-transferase N-terminal domain-containing protein [Zoogloeaceae bacterium]|nr:glutathione S-transferase N-terminal domain-containing protein [Rhodocyclaceae bacterium]MCP5236891.1 glutathione S-transferase N-terminal domain-containing protein [Zoogloeaceae bacterium]
MFSLYTWSTPNGRKASIMLEELGLDYEVRPIDITRRAQFSQDFTALSPNNKIPVIVDPDGPDGRPIVVFESGAILIYLAEKCGRLLPRDPRSRYDVLQWLMFQMGGVGPMFGQVHHFLRFADEKVPYAIKRYRTEAERLYAVLDRRLAQRDWIAGDDYSIADIATYPWVARHPWQQVDLADYPAVGTWFDRVGTRPAVQRGMEVPA